MRAFTMNLLNYNANTQCPAGGAPTPKQLALQAEMQGYRVNTLHGATVNVAAFTEVGVANAALQANVQNALNTFGAALNIPAAAGGRHLAVIRCGRTALVDSNEVVAIVLDGNAAVQTYGLLWFDNPQALQWQNDPIAPGGGRYTSRLAIPATAVPDYRYIVYVQFTLGGAAYTAGFIHNRAPGFDEAVVVMQGIRNLLEVAAPVNLTMCAGDFNVPAPVYTEGGGPGQQWPVGGHHVHWYYSPGLTTVGNRVDYWVSHQQLLAPGGAATASSDRTPTVPTPAGTGSDHRGVGLEIA